MKNESGMTVNRPLVGSDPRTWGPELPSQREYRLKKEKEAEDAKKKTTWLQRMKQIAKVVGAVGVAGLGAYAGYKGFNGTEHKGFNSKSKGDESELGRYLKHQAHLSQIRRYKLSKHRVSWPGL